METSDRPGASHEHPSSRRAVRFVIAGVTTAVVALGLVLVGRADSRVNKVALDSRPKGVTAVAARESRYRPTRRYVGTILPWIEARVGPQLVSAYVDTVLVRPGDAVKRGQVIATLDCRNASASSKAVSMQARAIQTEQEALSHEAARVAELKEGGFASPNEIEKRAAESASKGAQLMETQARMQRAALEVGDCIMRAPFAGEVSVRAIDPGAFIRPGTPVATVISRDTVRVIAEVPESDFDAVAPATPVRIRSLATKRELRGTIARRSPAADLSTRTVHVEVDAPDPSHTLPVGTTAEIDIDVGEPQPATEIPLIAAAVRGDRATVFVVDGDCARKVVCPVKGEHGASLFVDPVLKAGARVVTEGRTGLKDGDRIEAKAEDQAATDRGQPVAGAKQ